jgi:hypothetical protein
MKWLLCGSEYIDDGMNFGFVYLIENLITGRKYIGRKYFTAAGYKQVNGKRKKVRKESDWKEYYGSNEELKAEVEKLGKENFQRIILHLCRTKSECSYYETREIFVRDALLLKEYYNSWVQCKIRKAHLTNLQITDITK